MKKILILYGTAGIGHKKASLAVKAALDEIKPADAQVTIADSLDYTSEFFKKAYLGSYLFMVNKLPVFWGLSYFLTDNVYVNMVVSKLRRINNYINSKKLRQYIIDTRPDVIVSTHFFASEVIAVMKKKGETSSRLITVVTDYRLHSWWVSEPTDLYIVGGEGARQDLVGKWKIDGSRIRVLGIPVEPVFSRPVDRKAVMAKAGLQDGTFTVLTIGGGFGVGPIEEIVKIVDSLPQTLQMIVICGHNDALVRKIEELKATLKIKVTVLGFVNNVYEYMAAADVLISKSGGITSTESMAKGLPLIVIAPIIGQETRNSEFLTSQGAAIKIDKIGDLGSAVEDLVAHPEHLRRMRESIDKIKKPRACYDIAKLALEM